LINHIHHETILFIIAAALMVFGLVAENIMKKRERQEEYSNRFRKDQTVVEVKSEI